ncbi:MAG: nickel-dependent lactate racemase [Deltaproteobacteria bacterium]|nr:nickel-dependent lactate racemase [Deltaproteobacteria bacterium]
MQIKMYYGKKGLLLNLPDDWDITIIKKKRMPILKKPIDAVYFALKNPVGSKPLVEEAKGCNDVCILICDVTRPVPNSIILSPLIKKLLEAGIDADHITMLVAIKIFNHFAKNDDDHIYLGTTKRGIPVKLDRRFIDADLRIVTGLVEPHFMAGYSGGRKVITPGIAHQDTITSFHSAMFLEDPNAANSVVEGNPLHEEQLEILGMIGKCLAINTVIDEERRLSFVNFGDIVKSHLAAVEYAREYLEIPIKKRFKTVITSSAGYPLDTTYYQTVKGMVGAMDLLLPGGNLFIVSECSEGLGSPEFVEAQRRLITLGNEKFLEEILAKKHASIDEWDTEMLLKPMRIGNIHLYTEGLSESELKLTGVNIVKSLDEAIRKSVEDANDKSVAVIPEGPYVIPFYKPKYEE